MNFTREPIIETVITPREGCKLVIRSSKTNGEDYFVDAVEVVCFGNALFFRSLERPKAFLLPVSDYEVLELKETRMVLKNISTEKSIKINGGKKEEPEEKSDKKKRRYKRKRSSSEKKKSHESENVHVEEESKEQPTTFTRLFPPPATLIKENLSKQKEDLLATDIEEPKLEAEPVQKAESVQEIEAPLQPETAPENS